VGFEEDPNNEEQVSEVQQEPSAEGGRARLGKRFPRKDALALRQKGKKAERTPEELLAMGYDDVDDWVDDSEPAEELELKEDNPMWVFQHAALFPA
jgi:hypothetical protein